METPLATPVVDRHAPSRPGQRAEWVVVAAIAAAWLWLAGARLRTALGFAGYDDALFIQLAGSLTSGHWLGGYGATLLAKGPFYPLFIATCFALGIPLHLAESLLYGGACAALVGALAPVLGRPALRVGVFALLLLSPAAVGTTSRVVRECVYPSLTILVFAGAIGVALRAHEPWRATRGWVVLFGVSLAAFWLCREERAWIVPALVPLVALTIARRSSRRDLFLTALIAGVAFALPVGAVAMKNLARYGVADITEFTEGPFPGAYAVLGRVRHAGFRPRVPLPAEARKRIYAVSPSFAELAPYLEGELGEGWKRASCNGAGICDEIGGGWMMWALRDAAALAGHCRSGRDAAAFWTAVATEVESACSDSRLSCSRATFSFMPPWHRAYAPMLRGALARTLRLLIGFEQLSPHAEASVANPEQLADFRDLTRDRLAPGPDVPMPSAPRQTRLDAHRLAALDAIAMAYRATVPIGAAAALVCWVAAAVVAVRRRRAGAAVAVACSFLLALTARVVILALVDVTSFPAVNSLYLAPAYPLLLAFAVAALLAVRELVARPEAVGGDGPSRAAA